MAKRKRLEISAEPFSPDLETKSAISPLPRRAPVAQVAGDVAGRAAEAEMAAAMEDARAEGRVIERIPLARLEVHHMARDRMVFDDEEMETLQASIAARGQQAPVEVVRTTRGFGLISGMRRVEALRRLGQDEVLALIRRPDSAEEAYRAMIEENEIRADLSFYERANIAVMASEQGVFPTPRRAVQGLFAHVTPAKRSKILRFVVIREKIGHGLSYPAALTEKTGLALAKAIEADPKVATRIMDALRKTPPADAAAERRVIERALKGRPDTAKPLRETVAPDIGLEARAGRLVLTGRGVDDELVDAIRHLIVSRAKENQPSS